jgi:hypothetical protein
MMIQAGLGKNVTSGAAIKAVTSKMTKEKVVMTKEKTEEKVVMTEERMVIAEEMVVIAEEMVVMMTKEMVVTEEKTDTRTTEMVVIAEEMVVTRGEATKDQLSASWFVVPTLTDLMFAGMSGVI